MLSRDIEDTKKTQVKQIKVKNTMSEMKNTLGEINSRLDPGISLVVQW